VDWMGSGASGACFLAPPSFLPFSLNPIALTSVSGRCTWLLLLFVCIFVVRLSLAVETLENRLNLGQCMCEFC